MPQFRRALFGVFAALCLAVPAFAQEEELLSPEELNRAFQEAVKSFGGDPTVEPVAPVATPDTAKPVEKAADPTPANTQAEVSPTAPTAPETPPAVTPPAALGDVNIISDRAATFHRDQADQSATYVPLEKVRVNINMEQKTVSEVIEAIIKQAEPRTGPWQVRWRLRPENDFLQKEVVNLTAETSLEDFMNYLVENIVNMTGVKLFVKVFEVSRVIVISDTY